MGGGELLQSVHTVWKVSESSARLQQLAEDYRHFAAARRKQLDLSPSVRADPCQARGSARAASVAGPFSSPPGGRGQRSSLTWSIFHEAAVTSVPMKRLHLFLRLLKSKARPFICLHVFGQDWFAAG